jgi:hypothetical protein
MPARLKATARLSRTMTMIAATAIGSREMVVTSDWSTLCRSRVATYAQAIGSMRSSAPTIATTAASQYRWPQAGAVAATCVPEPASSRS